MQSNQSLRMSFLMASKLTKNSFGKEKKHSPELLSHSKHVFACELNCNTCNLALHSGYMISIAHFIMNHNQVSQLKEALIACMLWISIVFSLFQPCFTFIVNVALIKWLFQVQLAQKGSWVTPLTITWCAHKKPKKFGMICKSWNLFACLDGPLWFLPCVNHKSRLLYINKWKQTIVFRHFSKI